MGGRRPLQAHLHLPGTTSSVASRAEASESSARREPLATPPGVNPSLRPCPSVAAQRARQDAAHHHHHRRLVLQILVVIIIIIIIIIKIQLKFSRRALSPVLPKQSLPLSRQPPLRAPRHHAPALLGRRRALRRRRPQSTIQVRNFCVNSKKFLLVPALFYPRIVLCLLVYSPNPPTRARVVPNAA